MYVTHGYRLFGPKKEPRLVLLAREDTGPEWEVPKWIQHFIYNAVCVHGFLASETAIVVRARREDPKGEYQARVVQKIADYIEREIEKPHNDLDEMLHWKAIKEYLPHEPGRQNATKASHLARSPYLPPRRS